MAELDVLIKFVFKPFEDACLAAYENGRTVTRFVLPEGILGEFSEFQNPTTREMIPVRRVPLLEYREVLEPSR